MAPRAPYQSIGFHLDDHVHHSKTPLTRILWLLEELGLEYRWLPGNAQQLAAGLRRGAPLASHPDHGLQTWAHTMAESGAIIETLADLMAPARSRRPGAPSGALTYWLHFARQAPPPCCSSCWSSHQEQGASRPAGGASDRRQGARHLRAANSRATGFMKRVTRASGPTARSSALQQSQMIPSGVARGARLDENARG